MPPSSPPAPPAPATPPPGALAQGAAFGRYQIASQLATGGMATVWLAKLSGAEGFEKEVVIKTMLPELASSPEMVQMFINEATIAARLNHPNIVQVFDFGCLEGHHYIVMEHVAGRSLRQLRRRLKAEGRGFPRMLLLRAVIDVCRALRYAHELRDGGGGALGFVHGDISPENVMVTRAGATKLIDFGAAHMNTLVRPTGKFIGKYRYVSPERLGGGVGDARSDIYSLGVLLYEFLTGVRPFDGDDREIVAQVRRGRARDPREHAPDLPEELVAAVGRAMALHPDDRYQSTEQLAVDLLRVVRERSQAVAAAASPLPPPGAVSKSSPHWSSPFTPEPAEEDVTDGARIGAEMAGADGAGADGDDPDHMPSIEIHIEDSGPLGEGSHPSSEAPGAGEPALSVLFDRRPTRAAFDVPSSFANSKKTVGVRWTSALGAPQVNEAARHFDRGFVLAVARRYQEALEEWEMALAADPDNHMYQTNVDRLREHCRMGRA